jgi:hypothetical protein
MLQIIGRVSTLGFTYGKTVMMMGLLFMSGFGCSSIEGTRDKSQTLYRTQFSIPIERMAILPLPNSAASPQLSTQLAHALTNALQADFPHARIVSPSDFSMALPQSHAVEIFSQWKVAYEQTSILNAQPFATFAKAAGVQHVLMIRAISLDRERVRAVDTGRTGYVRNADSVWRARLRFTAEVFEASTGTVVWSGMGEAENVKSTRKDFDLGLVIIQQGVADLDTYLPEMCQVAATGFVRQLHAGPMGSPVALGPFPTTMAPEASPTHRSVEQATAVQHNGDASRLALKQANGSAPQCADPEVRTRCPLYQVRLGLYRAECADGSGLEASPGKLTVTPPPVERPRPWDAEACTL